MTKRTRLFLAASAAILVVGLGTGLLASYVGGFQNLTIIGGDGPSELDYVPADARFVAYADVRDVMNSELRHKLQALQPNATDTGTNRFKEQTGIDIETDIDYVVAAASGDEPGNGHPPLVLARGRFDEVRIEGLIRSEGGVVEDYKGSRLLVKDSQFALVFLEPGLAGMGGADAVRKAIDTKAAGSSVKGNAELMQMVRANDDGDAWVVARFDALTSGRLPAEVASQLPPINWFSAKGFVDSGLQGQLTVETRDEASAQSLQDVVRGFMALGRLQTSQHPEVAELLNSVQLSGDGKTVSLSFVVPGQVIDVLGALRAQKPRPQPTTQPEQAVPPTL